MSEISTCAKEKKDKFAIAQGHSIFLARAKAVFAEHGEMRIVHRPNTKAHSLRAVPNG